MEDTSQDPLDVAHGGPARPEIWHAGPRESEIAFSLGSLGRGEIRGRVERWKATFVVDLEQPRRSSIEVIIEAASLETGGPERDSQVRGERFLDVERFPEIRFRSREIYPEEGDRRLAIMGDLTIRDVTREIRIVVEHEGAESLRKPDSKLAFKGHGSVRRLDFGLRWQHELERGGLVASDVVEVDIRVNARRGAK